MGLTLGVIGAVTAIAGAVTGTAMGIAGAEQQRKQHNANVKMQEQQAAYNARVEEREAAALESENAENIRRMREESERLKAAQRAALGNSGSMLTSGSPLAVLGQTAAMEERNIQDAHYSGYRSVSQRRETAKQYRYQGAVAKASKIKSGNTIIQGVGQIGSGLSSVGTTLMNYGG